MRGLCKRAEERIFFLRSYSKAGWKVRFSLSFWGQQRKDLGLGELELKSKGGMQADRV